MTPKSQFAYELAERTRKFTRNLITGVPQNRWCEIPSGIDSNIAWQVGHIMVTQNYHAVRCVVGLKDEVMDVVPLRDYAKLFAMGSSPQTLLDHQIDPEILLIHFDLIHRVSMEVIKGLTEEQLNEEVIPGRVPHPVAKTKFEAVTWSLEHESWHAGQIAMIGRGLGLKLSIQDRASS